MDIALKLAGTAGSGRAPGRPLSNARALEGLVPGSREADQPWA